VWHEPDAVETDGSVEVFVTVNEAVESGEINYEIGGNGFEEDLSLFFNPLMTDQKTLSATIDKNTEIGEEVPYQATVENAVGNTETSSEYSYFSFKEVDEVAVIFATYSDADQRSELTPENEGDELEEYQENLSTDINQYYAGSNGSMGGIGFNFKFYENPSVQQQWDKWFTLNSWDSYNEPIQFFYQDNRKSFIDDARNEVGIGSDDTTYDTVVAVSSGDAQDINDDFNPWHLGPWDTGSSTPYSRIYVHEGDIFNRSHWMHELGHTQGLKELYDDSTNPGGNIGTLGVMSDRSSITPPRYSAVGRTELAEHPDTEFDAWLNFDPLEDYGEVEVSELKSKQYKDDVEGFGTLTDVNAVVDERKFVFEARDAFSNDLIDLDRGVYIYTYDSTVFSDETVDIMNWDVDTQGSSPDPNLRDLRDIDNSVSVEYDLSPDGFVNFTLEEVEGTGEDYVATVQAKQASEDAELKNVGTLNSQALAYRNGTLGDELGHTDNITPPRVDLHAYDEEGRHVGINYTSGEYEMEIPGAETSESSSYEWIAVPDERTVSYSIDTRRVEQFIEETDDVDWEEENTSSAYSFAVTDYGDNPEIVEEDGKSVISNTTIVNKRGQTIDSGVEEDIGVSADVEHKPDTLNLQNAGRFVNITVGSTPEGVNLSRINLSTVELNGEVEAVTDEQFGFVRNPIEKDTLKIKFLRDEVQDVLETGEEVRITVTGETTQGELIVGSDIVEVINEPNNGASVCPPKEGRGPPDEIPGEGPGDGPGERVGPPNETLGQGPPGEHPGRGLPGCPEDEDGGTDNEESTDDDELDDRREAGRGEDTPRNDRSDIGRGDNPPREDRSGIDREESLGEERSDAREEGLPSRRR